MAYGAGLRNYLFGGYPMTSTNKNIRKDRGFTLVELLVVIGIIAALAAVVIPNVSQFVGRGDAAANSTEAQTVQAAMDLYLADTGDIAVTVQAAATNDMTATTPALAPTYIRTNTTKCTYTWAAVTGIVTQVACP
jgi:prepilin-type N-terminal cleavage/methylation domain-containing protein